MDVVIQKWNLLMEFHFWLRLVSSLCKRHESTFSYTLLHCYFCWQSSCLLTLHCWRSEQLSNIDSSSKKLLTFAPFLGGIHLFLPWLELLSFICNLIQRKRIFVIQEVILVFPDFYVRFICFGCLLWNTEKMESH